MLLNIIYCLVLINLFGLLDRIQSATEVLRPRGVSLDSNYPLIWSNTWLLY